MSFTMDSTYGDLMWLEYGGLFTNFMLNNLTQLPQSEEEQMTGMLLLMKNGANEGNIAPVALLIMVSSQ